VKKTRQVLRKTDVAVLVTDSVSGMSKEDEELVKLFEEKNIRYIIACNKADLLEKIPAETDNAIYVSAKTGHNINRLKEKIAALAAADEPEKRIVGDLLEPSDLLC